MKKATIKKRNPVLRKLLKLASTLLLILIVFNVSAQENDDKKDNGSLRLYGFAMLDAGYDFNQINPDWYDVIRPTKLPAYTNEFGTNGNTYFSVRQTRFGVEGNYPTKFGNMKAIFEFELFGVGADEGQTTFRLRIAYGELGHWGAGQYWSPFMDIDVFPNSLEYWGPCGMVFFRNLQIRYMPIKGDTRLTFALEKPGASADQGVYADRIELEKINARFPVPDLSAEYRFARKWGYLELAGMLRYISWDHDDTDTLDLSGQEIGWGLNLSSNLYFSKSTTGKFQVVYGEGIENYMNDAPVDIGIQHNLSDPKKPIVGVTLPVLGVVAFIDQKWSDKFTSSIGYSLTRITNSDGQLPEDFRQGQYALVNLLYYPVKNMMAGVEFQYGNRQNYSDGFSSDILKIQFSFKYSFSHTFYNKKKTPETK